MRFALPVLLCAAIAFMFFQTPQSAQVHSSPKPHSSVDVDHEQLLEIASYVRVQTDLLGRNTDILGNIEKSLENLSLAQETKKSILVSDDPAPTPAPPVPKVKSKGACGCENCKCGPDCDCGPNCKCCQVELTAQDISEIKSFLAASRYPSVSSTSGGGSTGNVKVSGGGSTGNVRTVSSGGGSNGDPNFRTPVRTALSKVSTYSPRWINVDGRSNDQHVEEVHGLNTAGMTPDQIRREQDAYHDTYGPNHPVEQSVPLANSSFVSMNVANDPGCPGGYQLSSGEWVCPNTRSNYVQRSNQNTGWYPGKNLGRKR